jgi:hypothetical protein
VTGLAARATTSGTIRSRSPTKSLYSSILSSVTPTIIHSR